MPLGFGLALARRGRAAAALYTRTRFGFEVQVLGDSERAARYGGVRVRRTILAVMALSGAIAGLGGASQVGDFSHALDGDPNGLQKLGYGYTGIVVAALARYNPFAVVVIAFLLGGLENAGNTLQGAALPGRPGRRDPGDHPLLRARRRAARPLPRPRDRPPGRRLRTAAARAGGVNNSLLVVVLASGVDLRDAAPLRRARRAAGRALGRAQPRRRGDDARRAR